jgi:hypothetical protein
MTSEAPKAFAICKQLQSKRSTFNKIQVREKKNGHVCAFIVTRKGRTTLKFIRHQLTLIQPLQLRSQLLNHPPAFQQHASGHHTR